MKAAIIFLSDPKASEGAPGSHVCLALQPPTTSNREVPKLVSISRAPAPAGQVGVFCGCADVFGPRVEVEKAGFELIADNNVPGTPGLPSIAQISGDGFACSPSDYWLLQPAYST